MIPPIHNYGLVTVVLTEQQHLPGYMLANTCITGTVEWLVHVHSVERMIMKDLTEKKFKHGCS